MRRGRRLRLALELAQLRAVLRRDRLRRGPGGGAHAAVEAEHDLRPAADLRAADRGRGTRGQGLV